MKSNLLKLKAVFEIFLVVAMAFFVALPGIKAEDAGTCCKETNTGEFCVSGISKDKCKSGFSEFSICSNVDGCNTESLGCCEVSGQCNSQTTEASCKAVNGIFNKGVQCNELSQCQKACCVIGTQCSFKYVNECSDLNGVIDETAGSESSCAAICSKQDLGCCTETCGYGTKGECLDENFFSAKCANVALCADKCKTHAKKDCGDDGHIYWFDSCGNKEDIFDQCNPEGNNGETTSCSNKNNEVICKSWDCDKTWNNPVLEGDEISRKNGESWCEYQAAVGPGMDLPGTQHYLHSCIKGEEVVEPCGEKRERVCVYGNVVQADGRSAAACVSNTADRCTTATDQDSCVKAGICVWVPNEGEVSIEKNKDNYHIQFKLAYNSEDHYDGSFIIRGDKTGDKRIYDTDNGWDKLVVDGLTHTEESFESHVKGDNLKKYYDKEGDFKYETYNFEFDVKHGDYSIWIKNVDNDDERIDIISFSTDDIVSATQDKGYCVPYVPPANSALCEKGTNNIKEAVYWEEECVGGDWSCSDNCDLYGVETKKGMNKLCNMYGDCGAKYNLAGRLSSTGFKRNCDPNSEDYTDIEDECPIGSNGLTSSEIPFSEYINAGKGLYIGNIDLTKLLPAEDQAMSDIQKAGWSLIGMGGGLVGAFAVLSFIVAVAATVGVAGVSVSTLTAAAALCTAGPVGCIIGGVIAVAAIATGIALAVCTDDQFRDIQFSCSEWQAPSGAQDCSKCNMQQKDGGLLPNDKSLVFKYDPTNDNQFPQYQCTESLCKSLGSCLFQGETAEGPKCLELDNYDVSAPAVRYVDSNLQCNDKIPGTVGNCNVENTENGIRITGMLKEFSQLNITLKTINLHDNKEELAVCAYTLSFNETYDGIVPNFEEGELLSTKHTLVIANVQSNKVYSLKVFCEDASTNRNKMARPFIISFETAPEPDFTPPVLRSFNPPNGKAFVPYGITEKDVVITLNEPADSFGGCRFSDESGVSYEKMTRMMSCTPGGLSEGPKCTGKLTNLVEDEDNNFYFRCRDKSGNANQEDWPQEGGVSVPYIVKASPSLNISSIQCAHYDGPDCSVIYDKEFNLSLTTQEGAENGISVCSFNNIIFLQTNSTEHFQPGLRLGTGNHVLKISCYDIAGNTASQDINADVRIDNAAPVIKSIYSDDSTIKLITDEKANCKYEFNKTEFNFNNATSMTGENNYLHSFIAESKGAIIQCSDRFGNIGGAVNVYLL